MDEFAPTMREVTMTHSNDREWFVALGSIQALDSVYNDIAGQWNHISECPEEIQPIMLRIINTLEQLHEAVFDEENMPEGVMYVDTQNGD